MDWRELPAVREISPKRPTGRDQVSGGDKGGAESELLSRVRAPWRKGAQLGPPIKKRLRTVDGKKKNWGRGLEAHGVDSPLCDRWRRTTMD